MTAELPEAIATYFAIGNGVDPSPLSNCFSNDAIVSDEKQTHRGLPAIDDWMRSTRKAYGHTSTPLSLAQGEGNVVVTARVEGNFPGSPINLRYAFVLEHGRITSLEIGG